jgi:asparagine synthase (glutamine-hydrolysing)
MCGIVGLIAKPGSNASLERAVEVLAHRGPDDNGIWVQEPIVLGHTRLKILDLTEAAHQPMRTPDGRYALSFNGEIYNYLELRGELASLGHEIVSTGDAEVILHAFEQWGTECVSHFNGMWAFAIWDREERRLFCSRDRFGVKPFYIAESRYGFAFASEIKALLAVDPDLAEPNEAAIYRFLSTGLLDEDDSTFFRRVRQLPASHSMFVDANGDATVFRYYDVADGALDRTIDLATAPAELRELMTDAVRLRLRADVQVGTCLSGGMDSSTIVGLAGSLMERRISSFTSVYPGTDSDESDFARAASELYSTDAHWVEPRKGDFFGVLPSLVWHQDEPTSAPGLYSQWHVMKLAHGNVKVLLDGQGGDEILAGYLGYYAEYTAALMQDAARGKAGAYRRLRGEYDEIRVQLGGRDPVRAAALARTPEWAKQAYRVARRVGPGRDRLIDPAFAAAHAPTTHRPITPRGMRDPLNSTLLDSLVRATIPALLHYEDRNSMAFSIEARTPFLDYRLVEFCLAAPYEAKIRGWETKVLLREAMADILPKSILERRDKKGYPTPMAAWLREGLMPTTREILLSAEARGRGLLVPEGVAAMLDEHESGRADHHWLIWRLLTLELWYRTFIDSHANAPVTL